MRTHSCVIRPPDDTYISIHQCDIDLCDGNQCAAALIVYFENWHNTRIKNQKKNQQLNDIAEAHGDLRPHDETLWQWHTEKEIIDGIKIFRKDSIAKALKLLADKAIITISRNPNPRYKFDHTRFFIFHPATLNRLYGSKDPSAENRSRGTENRGTIELDSRIDSRESSLPSLIPEDDSGIGMVAEVRESYGLTSIPEEVIAASRPGENIVSKGRDEVEWAEGDHPPPLLTSPSATGAPKKKGSSSLDATEVLAYLNRVTGKNYRTPGQMAVRLSQGVTVEELTLVIDYLDATRGVEWKRDWFDQDAPFRKGNFDKNLEKAKAWRPATRPTFPSPLPAAPAPAAPGDDRAARLARRNASLGERSPYAPR